MKQFTRVLNELWLPILIVVLWWTMSTGSISPFFPSLETIMKTFVDVWILDDGVLEYVVPSVWRVLVALGISIVGGIFLGVIIGLVPAVEAAVKPIIDFFRTMPKPALIPIAILFLGIDSSMKIAVIVFGCIWPVLLNTVDGVKGVEPTLLSTAKIYGFSKAERLFKVILPSASPQIFAGIRVALPISLMIMLVTEMVAATDGLGYFMIDTQQVYAIPEMWSGILILSLLGYLSALLLSGVERVVLAWHRGWRAAVTA